MSGGRSAAGPGSDEPWWKVAVLYQVYPRSFADADGDGNGDLLGLVGRLDHLEWLGVDGLWLSPITPSPNADWGYDVSDFCGVDPDFGTLDDLDHLVAEAERRGIRIVLDLVPNHTSDRHPWFLEAASSRTAQRRDWYVWADLKPDESPPNNWVSSFGGPAWTLHPATEQYFLHNHLEQQPDLNWWNDDVRDAFDDILRFWLDRGIAGFRIDVCNIIVKDAELRDNPPATEEDTFEEQMLGQRQVYNGNRPEVHEVLRRWRALTETYPGDKVLIGETPVPVEGLASYYGSGDELHLAFNFSFISAPFEAASLRAVVEATEQALPATAWPAWTGSNHDMFRFSTRWADDDPRRAGSRCSCCCASGARRSSTKATRSAWAMSPCLERTCATLWVSGIGRTTPVAMPRARPCSGGPDRVAGSPQPVRGPGCHWAMSRAPTSRPNGPIATPWCTWLGISSPCAVNRPTFAWVVTGPSKRPTECGRGVGGNGPRSC